MRKHLLERILSLYSRRLEAHFLPPRLEFVRPEIREHFAVHFDHRRQRLPGKPDHLLERRVVRAHIESFVVDAARFEPIHDFVAPAAVGFDEETDGGGFHWFGCAGGVFSN